MLRCCAQLPSPVQHSLTHVCAQWCLFATPWTVAHPGKDTGVGCHFLPRGEFLTVVTPSPPPRSNPCLLCVLHWQADSSPLRHLGSQQKLIRISESLKYKKTCEPTSSQSIWIHFLNSRLWEMFIHMLLKSSDFVLKPVGSGSLVFSLLVFAGNFNEKDSPWIVVLEKLRR